MNSNYGHFYVKGVFLKKKCSFRHSYFYPFQLYQMNTLLKNSRSDFLPAISSPLYLTAGFIYGSYKSLTFKFSVFKSVSDGVNPLKRLTQMKFITCWHNLFSFVMHTIRRNTFGTRVWNKIKPNALCTVYNRDYICWQGKSEDVSCVPGPVD